MSDGWVLWAGGECPVPIGTTVEVSCRGIDRDDTFTDTVTVGERDEVYWRCAGAPGDILAYRLLDGGAGKPSRPMRLPSDPAERKGIPIATGVLDYFPLAIAEVARVSKAGNDQHNPGQPLHWDKTKSLDHADCISRHLIDRGSRDADGQRHSAKLAWRALALLETELEQEAKP